MTTIEQIKSALQAHIAEAEAATSGFWKFSWDEDDPLHEVIQYPSNDPEIAYRRVAYTHKEDDATFIAHARTMSPAACKCLLLAIEGLEHTLRHAYFEEKNDHDDLKDTLQSIRQEWHNLTTK
jgi:hypothetical protein